MINRKSMLTAAALAAVSAMVLAGCSSTPASPSTPDSTSAPSSSSAPESAATTTLNYFTWYGEEKFKPLADAFQAANPDIKLEVSSANADPIQYAQTLLTRASGNQLPDVFHLSLETRSEIIDAGLALDITGKSFLEGSDKTAQAMYSKGDRVYGMSLSAWAGVIIYNVDLLKQVGYDAVPEDLDGFIELGKKLSDAGITAYMEDTGAISPSFSPMLGGYYAATGTSDAEIFDDGKSFDTWLPVLDQWNQILESGVMSRDVVGVSYDQIKQSFMSGDLAMYRGGAWDFPDIDTSSVNYLTAAFPATDPGEPFVGGGPDSPYALSAKLDGDQLTAAEKLLGFLNSEEGLKLAEQHLGQVSTSTNYAAQVAPQIEDVYKQYIQTGKYYWVNWPRNGAVMGEAATAQFQLLDLGTATTQDVTKALDEAWQSAE